LLSSDGAARKIKFKGDKHMIKAGNPTEEKLNKIKRIHDALATAKAEPSESCANGKEHNFNFVMHGDGKESYFNLFECEHCQEFVKQEHKRIGEDAAYWA
jgi:ribosomal protein L15E